MKETGILVSCSDYHIFKKMHLNASHRRLDKYLGIVKAALDPRASRPGAISRTSPAPTVYGYRRCPSRTRADGSVQGERPAHQDSCLRYHGLRRDRITGAALPRSVPGHHLWPAPLRRGAQRPRLEWHGHNDFYKVVCQRGRRRGCTAAQQRKLRPAWHRRAHGQLPAGGHGD